ncbi:TonB-dependent siderophore receptor [Aliiglaciecola sp. SL4]|uniref:TonB-dependent siderophore receptor n=1 Tax=Aliiglaciecola sp. SL4 TaxID=3239806 RepID=UPI00355B32FA
MFKLDKLFTSVLLTVVVLQVASTELMAEELRSINTNQTSSESVEVVSIIAQRDIAGFLENQPSGLLFGFEKSLLDTPRSATFVSDETLTAFGVTTVDDLTAVAPGTFTASFYGVEGALNVRGTLAETYFHGFKRIENRGTYQTPIGSTSRVDILRGPPTANFGPGKIGGLLNLEPKTARLSQGGGYLPETVGEMQVTLGSYDKKNLSFQFGLPVNIGKAEGGIYTYLEVEDSGSYYNGIEPEHQILQVTADFELANDWKLVAGVMAYNAEGYVQTPGWNRVTQELIDDGTYVTGRDTDLADTNGNGQMEWAELSAQDPTYFAKLTSYPDYYLYADPNVAALDTNVASTQLSRHDVYTSDSDFSDTATLTGFVDLIKTYEDESQLKLQLFADYLDNQRFVSYGFPADYLAKTAELRVSYISAFGNSSDALQGLYNVGISSRYYDARRKESYNGGQIAINRRDISVGAMPNDTIGSPFNSDFFWDLDTQSKWSYHSAFAMVDLTAMDIWNLSLSGRYDYYDVESTENGDPTYSYATETYAEETDGEFTFSAMLLLDLESGFRPYVSYAESSAIEFSQAGDVSPDLVANGEWLSEGELLEGGIKLRLFEGVLTGSISGYRQERTELSNVGGNTVSRTRSEGAELELRILASEKLSFSITSNKQKTKYIDGFAGYYIVNPRDIGLSDIDNYGISVAALTFANSMYSATGSDYYLGELEDTRIPDAVTSIYATYASEAGVFDSIGSTWGVRYVSETSGLVEDSVKYPSYWTLQGSLFAHYGNWLLMLNIDNVLDETYFTSLQDLYGDVAVLPGKGREWRATVNYAF